MLCRGLRVTGRGGPVVFAARHVRQHARRLRVGPRRAHVPGVVPLRRSGGSCDGKPRGELRSRRRTLLRRDVDSIRRAASSRIAGDQARQWRHHARRLRAAPRRLGRLRLRGRLPRHVDEPPRARGARRRPPRADARPRVSAPRRPESDTAGDAPRAAAAPGLRRRDVRQRVLCCFRAVPPRLDGPCLRRRTE